VTSIAREVLGTIEDRNALLAVRGPWLAGREALAVRPASIAGIAAFAVVDECFTAIAVAAIEPV
jgi:hypothetical protein